MWRPGGIVVSVLASIVGNRGIESVWVGRFLQCSGGLWVHPTPMGT